ncbi:hypothetical protein WBO78_24030 [Bosea sp. CCNWLW174]|uniref:hypothetical protein n=1 Tax=Bosea sp. CCNWLY174 TaxID=3125795 RepID=UPI0030158822
MMIRFRTIEPKPAANTNKPTNIPTAAPAEPAPAAGKVTPRQTDVPGKPGGQSPGEKREHN